MRQRVKWIDIAKCLGIYAIYLGHFCNSAGLAYQFVFTFHVQLFFFISGCMSNYDREENILLFVWKKFKRIMIPFFCFAIVSIFINVITYNLGLSSIKNDFILVVEGCVRNRFFAGSLWFLSCLFVMEVIFKILKLVRSKIIMIVISIASFMLTDLVIFPSQSIAPAWFYNFDSALHYLVFYTLGYCLYPCIINLFELNTKKKRIGFSLLFVVSFVYMAFLFEGISVCDVLSFNPITNEIAGIIQPLIGIVFIMTLSKIFEGANIINKIGEKTLYLCGNEYIIKTIFPSFLSVFGLSVMLDNPLKTYIYTAILVITNFKILIPFEKKVVDLVKETIETLI